MHAPQNNRNVYMHEEETIIIMYALWQEISKRRCTPFLGVSQWYTSTWNVNTLSAKMCWNLFNYPALQMPNKIPYNIFECTSCKHFGLIKVSWRLVNVVLECAEGKNKNFCPKPGPKFPQTWHFQWDHIAQYGMLYLHQTFRTHELANDPSAFQGISNAM